MINKFSHRHLSKTIATILIVLMLSVFTTIFVMAQDGTEPSEGVTPITASAEDVQNYFPIQGRLTDTNGTPLNGTYDMTFRLYDVASGGAQLCSDTNSVVVTKGLFTSDIWGNCQDYITGQQLWLSIQVESDPEMIPRMAIRAIPYAWSLRPGAVINGSVGPGAMVHIENSDPNGRGIRVYATNTTGANYAIVGASSSPNGYAGYFYNSGGGTSLFSFNDSVSPGKPAIFGCVASTTDNCNQGTNPTGVLGTSNSGDGIQGRTSSISARGVFAYNTGAGIALAADSHSSTTTGHLYPTLYLVQETSNGDFVVGGSSFGGTRYWRVDRTGKGFFNGGTQASGADFAEQIAVEGSESSYEPGDVIVISPDADRVVELSTKPFDSTVLGVYSTKPAVLAGAEDTDDPLKGIPVAVVGIVPCKVSAENGPIHRGDLLVTASRPGYAMRAGATPPQGTVLGKAMQSLDSGMGVILILVTLQ